MASHPVRVVRVDERSITSRIRSVVMARPGSRVWCRMMTSPLLPKSDQNIAQDTMNRRCMRRHSMIMEILWRYYGLLSDMIWDPLLEISTQWRITCIENLPRWLQDGFTWTLQIRKKQAEAHHVFEKELVTFLPLWFIHMYLYIYIYLFIYLSWSQQNMEVSRNHTKPTWEYSEVVWNSIC